MVIPVPHSCYDDTEHVNDDKIITTITALSLHMVVVYIVTHLFLHCFAFHVRDRSADSLWVK